MRKNGFTLVELIVSLAVLGILAVSMTMVIGGNLSFLKKTKDISQETYLSQQMVELDMAKIKRDLKEVGHGLALNQVTIDGVVVDYHIATKLLNDVTFNYLVTPTQLPEYVLLRTFDVKATLKNGSYNAYISYPLVSNSVIGSNRPDPTTYSTHWMMDIQQWYVSKPGFYTPLPRGDLSNPLYKSYDYLASVSKDTEIGKRYPMFPNDYILIASETTPTILDLSKYAGRHLVYSVTPAAKSGRIGLPEYSEPVYISGLTHTENLVVHLDASYLDPSNVNHVENGEVKKWLDLSSGKLTDMPNQSADTDTATKPKLIDSNMDTEFLGRYVKFTNASRMLLNGTPSSTYRYVYSVARGRSNPIVFTDESGYAVKRKDTDEEFSGGWRLVQENYFTEAQGIYIGGDDVEIAEILVYSFPNELTSSELHDLNQKVNAYLNKKYLVTEATAEIAYLYPLNMEVQVDQKIELPYSVLAKMSDGTDKHVNVIWDDSSNLDTRVPGLITRIGRSSKDPSKEVTFTLRVNPILVNDINLVPMTNPLELNNTFDLTYEVLPSNATEKRVNWSSSNESVVTVSNGKLTGIGVGTATIRVESISNSSIFDEISVTVKTKEQIIREELRSYLDSSSIWIEAYSVGTNYYLRVKSIPGVSLKMTNATRLSGSATITIDSGGLRATVTRNRTATTYQVTVEAEKETFKETILYRVNIPRNSSQVITISK